MNDEIFEKIEQYLNGEMSADEQKQFELELDSNPDMASTLEIYRSIENKVPLYETQKGKEAELKNSIKKLNNTFFREKNSANKNLLPLRTNTIATWKLLLAAACATGVIVISVMWMKQGKENATVAMHETVLDSIKDNNKIIEPKISPGISSTNINKPDTAVLPSGENKIHSADGVSNTALYTANFKPDAAPENSEGPLQEAFEYYKNGDYEKAIASIDNTDISLSTRSEKTDTALAYFYADYYKALCNMAINKFTRAIPLLEKAITNSPDGSFKTKAQWYLALAYLQTNNKKKTETLLQELSISKSPNTSKAIKLLHDLQVQ